jgi:arginase
MNVHIGLIQVPYTVGDENQGSSRGPERLVQAGAEKLVAAQGASVALERIDRGDAFRDSGNASLIVGKRLASVVGRAVEAKQFPLILAGRCDVSKRILSGFDHAQCGVVIVWLDAHGDFNTPETTASGYFDGMSPAVITGHCYQNYWAQIGNSAPIPESATLLLGVRDLDPCEEEGLARSSIQMVRWHEGKPQSSVLAAFDHLALRVPEIYLHIDMDCLDSKVAPGVIFNPVPGGIVLSDIEDAIRAGFACFRVRACTLAVFNPDRDRDDKTLRTGLIEVVADAAREMR